VSFDEFSPAPAEINFQTPEKPQNQDKPKTES